MQKLRSWQPQHAGPCGPPWLLRFLRNDTYLSFPAESAGKCLPVQTASLYDARVAFYGAPKFFLKDTVLTSHILLHPTLSSNMKGFCGVCSGDAAWQECKQGKTWGKGVGGTYRGKDHCYLCVWKRVALATRYWRHWMKT